MIHYWGNLIEGVLWIGIAGIIYARTRSKPNQRLKELAGRASFAFFWFGISDFIEVGTGAWYKPIWLLVMKGACVVVLVNCLVKYVSVKKHE